MIGFCFLTYDDIERTDIWKIFFKHVEKSKYDIFVNPKNPNTIYQNKLFSNKIILDPYKNTSRYTFSLLIAQDRLLREAFKNENIKHFIFLSHNTIPTQNFEKLEDFLSNKESVLSFSITNIEDHLKRYETINIPVFDKKHLYCQDQWCILSRKDVAVLLYDFDKIENIFGNMIVPDEHVYINYLLHYKNVTDITCSKLTYIIWEKKWIQDYEEYNPKTFEKIRSKNIPDNFYFLRKVDKNTDIKISF